MTMKIPAITTQQMAEVDRLMIEEFHIELMQMMENAGRNLADCAQMLLKKSRNPSLLVLCGAGNNGGGGLVAARHLINRGLPVTIVLIREENQLKEIPAHQWHILQKMNVQASKFPEVETFDLILDAMIGYGLQGNPRERAAQWIRQINAAGTPVLSLDVPSGLDATRGIPMRPCVRANATLTLALPKTGLLTSDATPFVGDLFLADISVPPQLYRSLGLEVGPIFREHAIIKFE